MPPTTIRPATGADAQAIARVHVACWRESFAGLLAAQRLGAPGVAERERRWRQILAAGGPSPGPVWVAEQCGAVTGFAHAAAQRTAALHAQGFTGEVIAIFILGAQQRQGTGTALIKALAQTLLDGGQRAASLWCLVSCHA